MLKKCNKNLMFQKFKAIFANSREKTNYLSFPHLMFQTFFKRVISILEGIILFQKSKCQQNLQNVVFKVISLCVTLYIKNRLSQTFSKSCAQPLNYFANS